MLCQVYNALSLCKCCEGALNSFNFARDSGRLSGLFAVALLILLHCTPNLEGERPFGVALPSLGRFLP